MEKELTDDPGANPCIGAVAAAQLQAIAATSGLRPWQVGGRTLLPIVQGGMGVGVSAGGLAGTVAGLGGVGTISSVDLRRHHPDLMARTADVARQPDAKARVDAANLEALGREIARARKLAAGRGLVAINVMKAVMEYEHYVRHSLACGIDAVVVGAGLPLDLPELARDHPKTALVPILSDARGVQLLVRKWEKKGRLPDAIVIEHPRLAGGHLGAAKVTDLHDRRFDFDVVLPEVTAFLRSAGLEGRIPLIPAGGISCLQDIQRLQALGAAAVQLGTAFAVTKECDAHPEFKRILAGATPQEIVEFTSVAGLPARAVRTPWLDRYLRQEEKLKEQGAPAALQPVVRLPGPLRPARRQRQLGTVLHRQVPGPRPGWAGQPGAVLPRRRACTLRDADPFRAGTDAVAARRDPAAGCEGKRGRRLARAGIHGGTRRRRTRGMTA